MMKKSTLLAIFTLLLGLGAGFLFLEMKQKSNTSVDLPVNSTEMPSSGSSETQIKPKPSLSPDLLSAEAKSKLATLDSILSSKNDNDPRMDTDLKGLSDEVKNALQARYEHTPLEKRNERGTIVFLIGRELKSKEDLEFMKSVLMEKPCLSLENCSAEPKSTASEDEHLDGVAQTTADYPQIVALKSLANAYTNSNEEEGDRSELRAQILDILRTARNSDNPTVAREAESMANTLEEAP